MKTSEKIGRLTCDLARLCYQKDEYFAATFNLSPTEIKLLRMFEETDRVSIRDITEELMLTPGRVTHIMNSLEKKKIISRKADENDKRNIWVHLNSKSNPFVRNLRENRTKLHETILSSIGQNDQEQIVDSLEKLLAAIHKWRDAME